MLTGNVYVITLAQLPQGLSMCSEWTARQGDGGSQKTGSNLATEGLEQ